MATVGRRIKDPSNQYTSLESRIPPPPDPSRVSGRVIVLTCFLTAGTLIQGLLSRGFGLTLACMVNSTAVHGQSDDIEHTIGTNQSGELLVNECGQRIDVGTTNAERGYHGTFVWDSLQQANLVAIYSWGSMIVLPFSGFLISLVDARQTVALALTIIGTSMGIFPVVTQAAGYGGALAIRLLMGFSYAVISPSMDQIVANYTPLSSRNTFYAIITAGSYISAVIGNSVGGLLCESTIFGGWPAIYYIAAMLAAIWLAFWEFYLLVVPRIIKWRRKTISFPPAQSDTSPSVPPIVPKQPSFVEEIPGTSRSVRKSEPVTRKPESEDNRKVRLTRVSIVRHIRQFWLDVGRRTALWAMLPSVFASTCTTSFLINYIPTFYRDVLMISLKSNGLYSSLPFVAIIIGSFIFSSIADALKRARVRSYRQVFKRRALSSDWVSKILNTVGFIGSGTLILMVTFIPCLSIGWAVALLTIASGLYTGIFPGYRVSIVTLCPKWAAVISSVSTMTSVIAGVIFPYIQGSIVRHGHASEWHTFFLILIGIDIVAAVTFLIFGSVTPLEPAPYTSITSEDYVPSSQPRGSYPPSEVKMKNPIDDERTPLLEKQ